MRVLGGILIVITILLVIFGFVYGRDPDRWSYHFSLQMALPWFVYAVCTGVCSVFVFWMANVGENVESLEYTGRRILDFLEQGEGSSNSATSGSPVTRTSTTPPTPMASAQYLKQKESWAAKPGDNPTVPRNPGESDAHYWERVRRS